MNTLLDSLIFGYITALATAVINIIRRNELNKEMTRLMEVYALND